MLLLNWWLTFGKIQKRKRFRVPDDRFFVPWFSSAPRCFVFWRFKRFFHNKLFIISNICGFDLKSSGAKTFVNLARNFKQDRQKCNCLLFKATNRNSVYESISNITQCFFCIKTRLILRLTSLIYFIKIAMSIKTSYNVIH